MGIGDLILLFLLAVILISNVWSFWRKFNFLIAQECKYRNVLEKPGEFCLICPNKARCDRASEGDVFQIYQRIGIIDPEQAKKYQDEILASIKEKYNE